MENNIIDESVHDFHYDAAIHGEYFLSDGLKDPLLMTHLIEFATMGRAAVHVVYYTIDELKVLVNSPLDNLLLQKIKRHMHLITCNINLPGEVFRDYPVSSTLTTLTTLEFRNFLKNRNSVVTNVWDNVDSMKEHRYHFECSNFGRIRVDGDVFKPIEEKPGWLYIHFDDQKYPVYRFITETRCLCPSMDSTGWEVHHISNDGYDNTPGNLIWLKNDAHKKIGTPKVQKMRIHFDEDETDIKRIIEELNSQNDVNVITGLP